MAQTDANRAAAQMGIGFGIGHTVSGYGRITATEAGRSAAENTRVKMGIGVGGGSQVLYATDVVGTTPEAAELARIAAAAGIGGGSQSNYSA